MTDVITESQVYVPENPGNAVTNEWLIRELNRVAWTLQNVIHYKANIGGEYVPGACYPANTIVLQDGWLMYSKVATCDEPAPQPVGPIEYQLPDAPVWVPRSHLAVVQSGVRVHNLTEAYQISKVRVWIPAVTANDYYRLWGVNNLTGVVTLGQEFTGDIISAPGWLEKTINPVFILPGDDYSFRLCSTNRASSSLFDYPWVYQGSSNQNVDPGTGNTTRRKDHSKLRISTTSSDAVDRTTELTNVIIGSNITVVSDENPSYYLDYEVVGITNNTTWFDFEVVLIETGALGEPPVGAAFNHFDVPVLTASNYVELTDEYLTDPSLTGQLFYDGVEQTGVQDNAYGVDIQAQKYVASEDWGLLASTEGGSGGSTGDADWTNATLENGWVANANQPVQFRRTSAGVLYIRGRLTTKGTAGTVFTLPEGYRPSQNETFSQTWNVAGLVTSRLAVQTTGLVTLLDDGVTAIDNASVSCSCYIG